MEQPSYPIHRFISFLQHEGFLITQYAPMFVEATKEDKAALIPVLEDCISSLNIRIVLDRLEIRISLFLQFIGE